MRNNVKYCCLILALALIVGFIVYILAAGGLIVINFTLPIFTVASAISLIAVTVLAVFSASKSHKLNEAFCCCGNMSLIGGVVLVIISILSTLIPIGIVFNIAVGIIFFLLIVQLGGIWCFLQAYAGCNDKSGCCNNDYE